MASTATPVSRFVIVGICLSLFTFSTESIAIEPTSPIQGKDPVLDMIVNSIYDRARGTPYTTGQVLAYTGEFGDMIFGDDGIKPFCVAGEDGDDFVLDGNYKGAAGTKKLLCYDGHNGVDFDTDSATVLAIDSGVVVKVVDSVLQNVGNERGIGFGNFVKIRHDDGFISIYGHLQGNYEGKEAKIFVSKGKSVEKGKEIAISGNSGNSSGEHLHLEIFNALGLRVDPFDFYSPRIASTKFRIADAVSVVDDGNFKKLNVRESAGGNSINSTGQLPGAEGTILDGPIRHTTYTWWKIDFETGADGWVAEDFIKLQGPTEPPVDTTFRVDDVTANEGDGTITVIVTRTLGSGVVQSVDFATAPGTAVGGGQDYTDAAGTLSFNPGILSQSFTVAVNDDLFFELDENFLVNLSNPKGGALIGTPSAQVTINDNDAVPSFSIASSSATEGEHITFTVTRTGDAEPSQSVSYSTLVGTGDSAVLSDFISTTGILPFAQGEISKELHVNTVNDLLIEGDETFSMVLSGATGGAVIGRDTAKGTIVDNDVPSAPTVSISSSFPIIRSGDSVTLTWASTGVQSCSVLKYSLVRATGAGPNFAGLIVEVVTNTAEFSIVCSTPTGPISDSVTVQVVPIISSN